MNHQRFNLPTLMVASQVLVTLLAIIGVGEAIGIIVSVICLAYSVRKCIYQAFDVCGVTEVCFSLMSIVLYYDRSLAIVLNLTLLVFSIYDNVAEN